MTPPTRSKTALAVAVTACMMGVATPLHAEVREMTRTVAGTTLRYKVVLPYMYDPAKEYPAVLVFGGGPETMATVDTTLARNFRTEAERRGFIVVAPAAPSRELFFDTGARIFPEFLTMILADYKIEGGRFHIAAAHPG